MREVQILARLVVAAGFGAMSLVPLASAGAAPAPDGAALFQQRCAVCHSTIKGQNRVGPSLAGVLGRHAGTVPGFAYSPALKNSGIAWDPVRLGAFLAAPQNAVPGTRMPLGVPDAAQRTAIIRYLSVLK